MLMGYRGFAKHMKGKASPEHSLLKLMGSETVQKLMLAGAEMQGPAALDKARPGPRMWRQGSWMTQWMRSYSGTIPGGTSEIQRNIVAERVLGLPRA
jgi:alkylation response protein AidB-like acyl-CoA dehydrogenase